MAGKTTNKGKTGHSGFDADIQRPNTNIYPKGTRWKQNADGTSTPIYPKTQAKKTGKK